MDLGEPEKGPLLPVFCAGRSPSMGTAVALLGQMPILSKSMAVRGGGENPLAIRSPRARASKWRFAMSPFSRLIPRPGFRVVFIAALDAQLVRSSSDATRAS